MLVERCHLICGTIMSAKQQRQENYILGWYRPYNTTTKARDMPIAATTDLVHMLFSVLMYHKMESLTPSDCMCFYKQADNLDKSIPTCLIPVRSVIIEKLLSQVTKMLVKKSK